MTQELKYFACKTAIMTSGLYGSSQNVHRELTDEITRLNSQGWRVLSVIPVHSYVLGTIPCAQELTPDTFSILCENQ